MQETPINAVQTAGVKLELTKQYLKETQKEFRMLNQLSHHTPLIVSYQNQCIV